MEVLKNMVGNSGKIIEEAKIVSIDTDEKGYLVRLDNGESYRLGKKALWSWGRLQEGRKRFDERVIGNYNSLLKGEGLTPETATRKDQIRLKRRASSVSFTEVYGDLKKQRGFQAIIKDSRNGTPQLFSVASFKHIMLDPDRVKEIGAKVFSSLGINEYERHSGVVRADQLLGLYDKTNGVNLGLSFSAGNIYTQFAISISQMIELQICTNPLVWIRGMLSTYIAKSAGEMHSKLEWRTRILRLTTIRDEKVLERRLTQTVKDVKSGEKGLMSVLKASKKKRLTSKMAETILKAFCGSYGIGETVQGEIMSEYKESNSTSVYDLAQATSHIAWSSTGFRQDAKRARSTLTGIAAVLTTLKDPKETYQVCKQRLEAKAQ
jgi:hypothetical protein